MCQLPDTRFRFDQFFVIAVKLYRWTSTAQKATFIGLSGGLMTDLISLIRFEVIY